MAKDEHAQQCLLAPLGDATKPKTRGCESFLDRKWGKDKSFWSQVLQSRSRFKEKTKIILVGGPCVGRKTVFNRIQEAEISFHILSCKTYFYGITLTEL
ncbi:hypothetical protein PR048_031308 [Dryococelus australis]|uniref:Uncharacterized protein n=1 Tax=Dryococelus australis TaxID=614101 RepID=A0ABQ9G7M3_9NEOP|nr:hypothetical protein PR048_031308 [Dryococelus australis]